MQFKEIKVFHFDRRMKSLVLFLVLASTTVKNFLNFPLREHYIAYNVIKCFKDLCFSIQNDINSRKMHILQKKLKEKKFMLNFFSSYRCALNYSWLMELVYFHDTTDTENEERQFKFISNEIYMLLKLYLPSHSFIYGGDFYTYSSDVIHFS